MLLHNLKQIFRSLLKYKSFTIINISGLSIGVAAALLIFLIADYEKRFDRFHANGNSIYRIVTRDEKEQKPELDATVPSPTARYLRNESPGIIATQVHYSNNEAVQVEHQAPFEEKNLLFADSLFFKVFDYSVIPHFQLPINLDKKLAEPGKVILTKSTAERYFGHADAIGRIIKIAAKLEVEVAAVIPDPPVTTHLPFNMIISYPTLNKEFLGGLDPDNWGFRSNGYCYVRTDERNNQAAVVATMNAVNQKYSKTEEDKGDRYYLQPLYQVHFDPAFETTNPSYTVSNKYLTMLLLLGGVILLIACINYINLSTSLAFSKAKEVGIRKTIGATKWQLFFYYMSETVLITTISVLLGVVITIVFIPMLNKLLEKTISPEQLLNPVFILEAVVGLLITSFLSGAYPAFILSGFKPIESLKNKVTIPGRTSTILRKGLVVFQFTISVALIICTIIIAKQMQYFNSLSLGFNKEAVVEVKLPSSDSAKRAELTNLLQNQSGIKELSFCLGAPISDNGINTSLKAPELNEGGDYSIKIMASDLNYLQTYGIKLAAGRWFMKSEEQNLGSGIVVNETLVKTLGFKNPSDAIGKKIVIGINKYEPMIIGVTKDFHTSSLHESIGPVGILPFPYFYYAAAVRMEPGSVRNTLPRIESSFKQVYPDYVYSVSFIDEQLARLYKEDKKNYNLFKAFSAISIFICCIGLWGLIAFVVVRKTKEIGVRKVLGATVPDIITLLSKEFVRLVLVGFVIASPIAWYYMNQWLENFAYRIDIKWWIFALAAIFATIIAFLSISIQVLKAALANPVKNLRTE